MCEDVHIFNVNEQFMYDDGLPFKCKQTILIVIKQKDL